jgi:hypothetical protein
MQDDDVKITLEDIGDIECANIAPLDFDTLTFTDHSDLIDLGSMAGSYNLTTAAIPTITLAGSGGTGAYNWNSHGTYTNTWTNAEIDGSLTIGGVNIMNILNTINDRLAILVPDPSKLEKYSALKEAYDHYKTLEALCIEPTLPPETK